MKRSLIILLFVGGMLLQGCASTRRYIAPTEEDYAKDRERQTKEQAKLMSDGGFFAAFGWIFSSAGSLIR